MREAQSDVECGAAPVFRAEEAMKLMSHKRRDLQQLNASQDVVSIHNSPLWQWTVLAKLS